MDDHRVVEPVSDAALERDIETALAVDPSPEFLARVRARVATEAMSVPWRGRWDFVAAAAALASVLVALTMFRPGQTRTGSGDEGLTTATFARESPRVAPSAASEQAPTRSTTPVTMMPALRPSVAQGTPAIAEANLTFPEVVVSALDPINEITIQAIAIEPLATLALLEGERQ